MILPLALLSCARREPAAPPQPAAPPPAAMSPVSIIEGSRQQDVIAPGQPLLTLTGGPLRGPLVVPLWLDLRSGDEDAELKQPFDTDVGWFLLPGGRLYIDQSNVHAGIECRIFDPATGVFAEPAAECVESSFYRRSYEGVSEGLVAVSSSAEGCAEFQLVRWDERAGPKELLRKSLGCVTGTLEWERAGDGLILRSNCDLSGEGCPPGETLERAQAWRWTEAGGLSGPED